MRARRFVLTSAALFLMGNACSVPSGAPEPASLPHPAGHRAPTPVHAPNHTGADVQVARRAGRVVLPARAVFRWGNACSVPPGGPEPASLPHPAGHRAPTPVHATNHTGADVQVARWAASASRLDRLRAAIPSLRPLLAS